MKLAIFCSLTLLACAHKVQVPEQPETVGNLSQSYHSIAVAPVKTTDEESTDSFVEHEKHKEQKAGNEEATPDIANKHDCEFDVNGCK